MALLLTPYTLVMSEKNRLRQLNFTKRREAEGFKRILFWLKPDERHISKKHWLLLEKTRERWN